MLRSFLLSLSKARWAQEIIIKWGLTRRASRRFIAGETIEEAVEAIKALNIQGILASVDHLGENTNSETEAKTATEHILAVIQAIEENQLQANVSIKLSQIGLNLPHAICQDNLHSILTKADSGGVFVRIDMEDATVTTKTLEHFHWARKQGFSKVGIVLQAYLYRTSKDLDDVLQKGGRIRLCKGAYNEQASVAYPKKTDVDLAYDKLITRLIEGALAEGCPEISNDGRTPPIPAIATHDIRRINFARMEAERQHLSQKAIEFQMLYGIRRDLQESLAKQGYPVRVYVPFGTQWYPYFMRRLAERPANIWFFLSNLLRK